MNEETLTVINSFNELPDTNEKSEICRQYRNDEISTLDFFSDARAYLDKQRKET